MGFISPLFLWGALAAASPIIIYYVMRRKVRQVDWAAMQFLLDIVQERKTRWEEILLIILRTLMLLFLALAIAQPTLHVASGALASLGGRTDVVLLIDDTYSTATRGGAQSRFAVAQELALKVIDDLPSASGIALLLGSEKTLPLIRNFSPDHSLIKETVKGLKEGALAGDIFSMLQDAGRVLESGKSANKKLFLISDFQAREWQEIDEKTRKFLTELATKYEFTLIPVSDGQEQNVAAKSLELPSDVVRTGAKIWFTGYAVNRGSEEAKDITAELVVENNVYDTQTFDILPGKEKLLRFTYTPVKPGAHRAALRLRGDFLETDNTCNLPFTVSDEVKILAVLDSPRMGEEATSLDFFDLAINPFKDRSQDPQAAFLLKYIGAGELGGETLDDYELVVFSGVAGFTTIDAKQIEEYVARGGAAVFFLGPETRPELYNSSLYREGKGLFSLPLAEMMVQKDDKDEPLTFTPLNAEHPLWNGLLDPKDRYFEQAMFFSAFAFKPGTSKQAFTLAEISDDKQRAPFIMEFSFGRGRAFVFGSSAGLEMNNLALRPVYVGMINQLVRYARRFRKGETVFTVGAKPERYIDFQHNQATYQITFPSGESTAVSPLERNGEFVLGIPEMRETGFYKFSNNNDASDNFYLAANVSPNEGAIKSLAAEELRQLYEPLNIKIYGANADEMNQGGGWEFSAILLWLMLLCWIGDNYLGYRISTKC